MLRCSRWVDATAAVVSSVLFFWLRARLDVRHIWLPRSHSGYACKCTCILPDKEYLRVFELLPVCTRNNGGWTRHWRPVGNPESRRSRQSPLARTYLSNQPTAVVTVIEFGARYSFANRELLRLSARLSMHFDFPVGSTVDSNAAAINSPVSAPVVRGRATCRATCHTRTCALSVLRSCKASAQKSIQFFAKKLNLPKRTTPL